MKKSTQKKIEQPSIIDRDKLFLEYRIVGRIFSTYWIVEQAGKMFVIDQHAAHERIIYEKLVRESLDSAGVVSQQLLTPERLTLTAGEQSLLEENMEGFESLGFELEKKDCYYLKSVPVLFSLRFNKSVFMDILDIFLESGRLERNINSALASAACKASVKANDRISETEAKAIIESLLSLENPFTCPHGRPTIIEMTRYELEKKFKRV